MTGFGVDVEADVCVASPQVDDEVRVVIHWVRNTELVTHPALTTFNAAAAGDLIKVSRSVCVCVRLT